LLEADCSDCCKIELINATLTATESSEGSRLRGKAALDVHNSTLHGITLYVSAADVTVSFISSHFLNSPINMDVLTPASNVIVNSKFEPALNPRLLNSSVLCSELQRRGTCDRSAVCSDETSDGRHCDCPFGFQVDRDDDGSKVTCLNLCELASRSTLAADSVKLSPSGANVMSESARLSFSNLSSLERKDLQGKVRAWLVPKYGTSSASLSDAADLVRTGITSTGAYELQLRSVAKSASSSTICTLLQTLRVQCTPGQSAADGDGMPCMPIVNITAASVRILNSVGKVLFDGRLLAPIPAGDKLVVEVTVVDVNGELVTRSTLGLSIELRGKKTNEASVALSPPVGNLTFFNVTISEQSTQEPDEVQSAGLTLNCTEAEIRVRPCYRVRAWPSAVPHCV
jgi:hypothetical protein